MNEEQLIIKGYQPTNSNDEQPKPPTTGSDVYKDGRFTENGVETDRAVTIRKMVFKANNGITYIPYTRKNKKTGKETTVDYAEVKERITAFRFIFPEGAISTKIIEQDESHVVIRAEVFNENGSLLAVGHAHETSGSSYINETSMIENCETSAVGRALGILGIGIKDAVASIQEVSRADGIKDVKDDMKLCHRCGRPIRDTEDKSGTVWSAEDIAKITLENYGDPLCFKCLREIKAKKTKIEV